MPHRLASGHTVLFRMRDDYNRMVHGELMLAPRGLMVAAARISTAGAKARWVYLSDSLLY